MVSDFISRGMSGDIVEVGFLMCMLLASGIGVTRGM